MSRHARKCPHFAGETPILVEHTLLAQCLKSRWSEVVLWGADLLHARSLAPYLPFLMPLLVFVRRMTFA